MYTIIYYAAVTLNAIMEGGPFVFRGGPNIADTDGPGGPLIPNIDGPGGTTNRVDHQ